MFGLPYFERLTSMSCFNVVNSNRLPFHIQPSQLQPRYIHMKNKLNVFSRALLLLIFTYASWATQIAAAKTISTPEEALATETFVLQEEMEVGVEIEARSPGASWAREGAEAAALSVSVDGVYNQDLLLWAGEELFPYRLMLGRLAKGKHTVSVSLNIPRSAAGARRAEVKALHEILLTASRTTGITEEDRLALMRSPILFARANTIDHFTDIPLLMYYEILPQADNDKIIRYTVIFTNEDGGTQTAALLARWGRGTDIEWVYEFRVRDKKIVEEKYQGVRHETKFFTGSRTGGSHPLLAVASDNNNFSDMACSNVRFAPLPIHARLETATRESVMDLYPQTYRVMTEELMREHRISPTPGDINTIADPREYFYIEASSDQQGAALGFDVKVAGQAKPFATDMGDGRLRIDRSGNFRTAVRLPAGVSPAMVESVTARCHASSQLAAERGCKRLKLLRVLMLDQSYVPRVLPLRAQSEASLAPGETIVFKVNQQ